MNSFPNAETDTVPLKYVRTMLRVARAQGYQAERLVGRLNSPVDLLDSSLDPNTLLPSHIYTNVCNQVMWVLQDESFGLALKKKYHAGTFRMMCLSIIHCHNLEHAMRRAAEFNVFCRTLSGDSPACDMNPIYRLEDGSVDYLFPSNNELLDLDAPDHLRTMSHCIAIWRRFCGWLIGKNIELIEVSFQGEVPASTDYFKKLFKCRLRFGQPANSFRFSANYLQAPLIHTEESLKQFLRNAPYHLFASTEEDNKSIISQMKRIIGNDFSREFLSVVDMADHLNMSVRTLRRRLKNVGTTYQQFKDALRCDAAKNYLNRPELKINAISALLGFDEPSAFHRSFKKWTTMTPGEYRQRQQQSTHTDGSY